MDLALRRGQLEDKHVFGEPAAVARHDRGDAQGVALLAEQGVAAIAGAIGPDLPGLGEMDDVLGLVAGPGDVRLARRQRRAQGVDRGHEEAVFTDRVQGLLAHAGHHPHGDGDIGAVGDLDAQGGDLRADRAHGEGHHIHGAAAHAALEQAVQGLAHLGGRDPVVGRPGVDFILGADEGPALHPGHVLRIGGGVEGVRALRRIEAFQGAGGDQLVGEPGPFGLGAVAPMHAVRLGQRRHFAHPLDERLILRRRRFKALNGEVGSQERFSLAVFGPGRIHNVRPPI